jgi:hypothetical protein
MAKLIERYKLRNDTVLRQRINAATWDKALRVFTRQGSTPEEKAAAAVRLKRELPDHEHAQIVTFFAASGGSSDADDAALQNAVDKVYDLLPAP